MMTTMADYGYIRPDAETTKDVQNIAAGGCSVPSWPNPYIGDAPPFTPYLPLPVIAPGSGTTTTLTPPKETTMDIYVIWAIVPDQPDAPWVVGAWDAESRAENEDGWLEDLAKAEEEYGARFIRVTRSKVDYDKVVAAFAPVDV